MCTVPPPVRSVNGERVSKPCVGSAACKGENSRLACKTKHNCLVGLTGIEFWTSEEKKARGKQKQTKKEEKRSKGRKGEEEAKERDRKTREEEGKQRKEKKGKGDGKKRKKEKKRGKKRQKGKKAAKIQCQWTVKQRL